MMKKPQDRDVRLIAYSLDLEAIRFMTELLRFIG